MNPTYLSLHLLAAFSAALFGFMPAAVAAAENVVTVSKFNTPPPLDGTPEAWADVPRQVIRNNDGAAAFQLGYDADYFYARIQVVDKSPLKNSAAVPEEMLKGGDAVGLFFGNPKTGGQRVLFGRWQDKNEVWLHRPKSEEKKPYTFASPVGEETFEYVGVMKGARVFTQKLDEGYVVDLALPWKTLDLKPTARMPFDLQVIFSDPSGSTNVGGVWWHSNNGAQITVEDLPTEARLDPGDWGQAAFEGFGPASPSAAPSVFTAPSAVRSGRVQPGATIHFTVPRDGRVSLLVLDQSGWIVRELLAAEKHKAGALTVEWDGRDRYNEPLPPGQYTWKALVFDGVGSRFLGSVGNSGRPPYRTPDGLGTLGGQHGVMKSVGVDSKGVILAGATEEGPASIRKVDPKTIEAVWKRAVGFVGSVVALTSDDTRAVFLLRSGRGEKRVVELVLMDLETGLSNGDMKKRYEVDVPPDPKAEKTGLALAGDKVIFSVFEQNRLGGVDLKTGENLPVREIPSPRGLYALDDNRILVCSQDKILEMRLDSGATKVFLSGFEDAGAVCLDKSGNIYVSDLGTSQQIKKFDSSHKLVATFGKLGGKPSQMDPYDPLAFDNVVDIAIGPAGNLWLAEVSKIPNRVVRMTTTGKWLEDICGPIAYNTFGPDLDDPSIVYYNMGGDPRFVQTQLDYEKYAANPMDPASGWKITAIQNLGVGADGKTPNELMAAVASHAYGHVIAFTANNGHRYMFRGSKGNRTGTPPGAGIWIWRSDHWVPAVFLSKDKEDKKDKNLSWQDKNGDGLMQDDERFSGLPTQTFSWLHRDLVLDGYDGTLAPTSIGESGIPDYQKGEYHAFLDQGKTDYREGWNFPSQVADGAVYYIANPGPERHLTHWDTAHENRLIKVKDGHTEWVIGEHSVKNDFTAFTTATGVAGIVDDMILTINLEPAIYIAFTTDGFTLGNATVDENGERPRVGPLAITIESFTGLFIKDPKTGRRMLFSVVSGDDRILEITGPGELTRLEGNVSLSSSTPLEDAAQPIVIPYVGWRGKNNRVARIDAVDAEWPEEETGYSWSENGVEVGDIRLRRDDAALHVFANVLQSTPFTGDDNIELAFAAENGTSQTFIEITGSYAEDGKFKGKGLLKTDGEPREIKEIKVDVEPRWHGLGWRMEASIPMELLGDLSVTRPQIVRRIEKDPRSGRMIKIGKPTTLELADLPAKFHFKATLTSTVEGQPRQLFIPTTNLTLSEAP